MARVDLLLILAWLLALPNAQEIIPSQGVDCLPYINGSFKIGIVVGACGSIILFALFTWLHGVAIRRRYGHGA